MPLFSVIIPVYNAAATLPQTLESLARQSFKDFEVLVVNDGSTDNSLEILKTETKEWTNIHIINQENKGLGHARNTAAGKAKGDWLAFLDADDYWASDKLLTHAQYIANHASAEFIYHAIFERYVNGRMRKRKVLTVHSLDEFVAKGNPFVPSALAIKRIVFLDAGGFIEDREQVEDLLLWFRLLHKKVDLLAINRPLTVYSMGAGVTGNLEEHLQKVKQAADQARQEELINQRQFAHFLDRKNFEAARQLHKLGQFEEANLYYNKCTLPDLKAKILFKLNQLHFSV